MIIFMNAIKIWTLSLIMILFAGCEKDSDTKDYMLVESARNKYYESEIFNETYLNIYGKWNLYGVSGGFFGGGHEPNFDYLEIKEFGIYDFIRNDSILEFGEILIDEQTDETLLISFEADDSSDIFMGDNEKYVYFYGKDTISLSSPCCDRYNYHFD